MDEHTADIEHLAELARLRLDDQERQLLATQLERILAYVRQLQQVDVDGVAPTRQPLGRSDVLREDLPEDSLPRERVLAEAPETDADQFVVPGVLPK